MKHLITLIIILLPSIAIAQVTDAPIDFLKLDNADLTQFLKYNKKARVKISNINRFIYKVSVEKTETDFNVTVPAVLSGIKLPGFLTTQMPATTGAPAPKTITPGVRTASQLEQELIDALKELIKARNYLNAAVDMHNKVVHISKDCNSDYSQIESLAIAEIKTFLTGTLKTTIPGLADELETGITTSMTTVKDLYPVIEELLKKWKDRSLLEYRITKKGLNDQLVTRKNKIADLQEELKALTAPAAKAAKLAEIRTEEKQAAGIELTLKENEEDYTAKTKVFDDAVTKGKTLFDEINKFKDEGKLYSLVDDIRKVNLSNYTYYSEMVEMKKDEAKFSFSVAADGPMACDKASEQKFTVKLRAKGGIKLDFSTGFFLNFGNDDFLGKEYYYKSFNTANDTVSIISADAGKRILLSIGALMHIYWRTSTLLKPGIAIGASVSTGFDALNLHVGPCLIIGDKDRLCVTGGLSLREVKTLDKRYETDRLYVKKLLPDAIPTIKKFPATGFFLAVTYNFSRFTK